MRDSAIEEIDADYLTSARAVAAGEEVVKSVGCLSCHSVGGLGSDFAPALDNVGSKVTPNFPAAVDKRSEILRSRHRNAQFALDGIRSRQCRGVPDVVASVDYRCDGGNRISTCAKRSGGRRNVGPELRLLRLPQHPRF